MFPLGSILRKYDISFLCNADDTQIYLLLKQTDTNSLKPLLDCLEDIKAWMSLKCLNFNKNKTEVLRFGPSGACNATHMDLYAKPTVKNLGVIMDSDFKLDKCLNLALF